MMKPVICPGDLIIYRKTKIGSQPGPRATNVYPARHGETYNYTVDKFWVVDEVLADGTVVARTRRGKRHQIKADDPNWHRASLWERFLFRSRFAAVQTAVEDGQLAAHESQKMMSQS